MPTRDERAEQAAKTCARMKAVFSKETQSVIDTVKLYNEGDGWNLPVPQGEGETQVRIERGNIARALFGIDEKTCVLDPASFTRPAASFMAGGWGPEAMLCAASNLYLVLESMKESFYDKNKPYFSDGLFNDRAAYLSGVTFIDSGKTKQADVLVMAEPDRKRALQSGRRSEAECDVQLRHRIQSALGIAAANGCTAFVASGFACGFSGNAPELVASIFKEWLEQHPGVFAQVVFVLGANEVVDAFSNVFPGALKKAEPKKEEVAAKESEQAEDDEDDMTDIPAPNADGVWVF